MLGRVACWLNPALLSAPHMSPHRGAPWGTSTWDCSGCLQGARKPSGPGALVGHQALGWVPAPPLPLREHASQAQPVSQFSAQEAEPSGC